MATPWGDFLSGTAQRYINQSLGFSGPTQTVTTLPQGIGTPRNVTVDTVTGEVKPCRRRRRRRLLTPTDLSDLAALQALVGKGSTSLNMAVAKAVRR